MHQPLNDREQQVCSVGLKLLLDTLDLYFKENPEKTKWVAVNEFDLLKPEHTRAHVMTALSKLSGKAIAGFYAAPPEQNQCAEPDPENPIRICRLMRGHDGAHQWT